MKNRIPEYFQLQRYNIVPEDMVKCFLRCAPEAIQPRVIVTPYWREDVMSNHADDIKTVSEGVVHEITYKEQLITFVTSGIGAPRTGDIILALGCTPCDTIVFTGSVGGLDPSMKVGDLVITEKSLCGDGFSRYLGAEVQAKDCFSHATEPDPALTKCAGNAASELCRKESVTLHRGTIFSIDTIIAQFFRLDYFVEGLNCNGIEMETSAVFKAAKLLGIKACALLQISDVTTSGKSLFSGRTAEDRERQKFIREGILTKAILDSLVVFENEDADGVEYDVKRDNLC